MNTLEERLRAALDAKADTFSASPDAWQQIDAKDRRGSGRPARRGIRQLTRRSPLLLPAAAAAVVTAAVLGATAVAHGFAGSAAHGGATVPPSTTAHQPPPAAVAGAISGMLAADPAVSAIIKLNLRPGVTNWAWIGSPSPQYWNSYITSGPQFCHFVTSSSSGAGSGDCWPMPSLSPADPAKVTSRDTADIGSPILSGVAEPDVSSVTAVFPDGQRFRGVLGKGRGFPVQAWSVICPAVKGTKLIFTGPAGQTLATLSTSAPVGPIVLDLPQPAHGGITMFGYPAGRNAPAGTVTAYLIGGHVAFFDQAMFGELVSPAGAAAAPAIAGLAQPLTVGGGQPVTVKVGGKRVTIYKNQRYTLVKAFGYAHADVTKVVVGLPGGDHLTAIPFPAGWPGSDLRLWQISIPPADWNPRSSSQTFIATAYNAAGQVVGRAKLAA
jgi:hypothetical protein